jgi:uncharacterized integral membrane protein
MDSIPPTPTGTDHRPGVPRTRTGGLWIASVVFAAVLLLLLVFILQNTRRAEVSFFGARANPPIGVALLLAAVFGVLLVALPGTARILQLRFLARRRALAAAERAPAPPATPRSTDQPAALDAPPDQDPLLHDDHRSTGGADHDRIQRTHR